ncbi:hypothetical protein VQ643_09855 [Pseudomonas sp. F1_0610]|uniref:hypothetical protein n=1 Tax=Pseudomonas sp. F1_0610 TaxID=3114284 RepID=UPI0039C2C87A
MARLIMEAPILGVQVTKVDDKVYAKVFVGEEPDGITEAVSSIMAMPILEGHADEVFAASKDLELGELCRFHIETSRGGKQTVRNDVYKVEPVNKSLGKSQPQPAKG